MMMTGALRIVQLLETIIEANDNHQFDKLTLIIQEEKVEILMQNHRKIFIAIIKHQILQINL